MLRIIAVAQCFLVFPGALSGSVIYVDQSASSAIHDGATWCSAHLDLQDALAIANTGDEIRVANGKYRPDSGS